MSEYIVQDTTLTNIANAIRSKTGNSNSVTVSNMANMINNISTKSDLSFITAGAEQILSGYVGSDTEGNPINGTKTMQLWTAKQTATLSPEMGYQVVVTFPFNPGFVPDLIVAFALVQRKEDGSISKFPYGAYIDYVNQLGFVSKALNISSDMFYPNTFSRHPWASSQNATSLILKWGGGGSTLQTNKMLDNIIMAIKF